MSDLTPLCNSRPTTMFSAFSRTIGSLLVAGSVIGCALTDTRSPEASARAALPDGTEIAGKWTAPEWDSGAVDDGWIASFRDEELETLVDEAVANNLNLQVAAARVERAEGIVELAEAGLKPVVGAGAEVSRIAGPEPLAGIVPVEGSRHSGGLNISWEADVWGRIRAGISAAELSLDAARADYEGARLSIAGATAKAWFLAQELHLQVRLTQQVVQVLTELTALVRRNFEVGSVSREDVFLVEADLAAAQAAVRQTRAAQTQVVRALELLLGRYPAASLEASRGLVAVPPPVPAGMPSELLERRPDLIAAERRVAAAFRLEEQARLARLPRFAFSGGVGGASALTGVVANFASGVIVPIYAPALKTQIAIASADQKATLAAYGQAVLRSLEEVETALFNDHIFGEREQFLAAQAASNRKALAIHRKKLEVGQISALPLLQVQARLIGSEVLLLRVRNERLAQRVDLHLALGGSF
jgi:NodT family efflux transporter outer membrane factor (OMF) lipoprotein